MSEWFPLFVASVMFSLAVLCVLYHEYKVHQRIKEELSNKDE